MSRNSFAQMRIGLYIFAVVIIFLLAWYVLADYFIRKTIILPDPSTVLVALIALPHTTDFALYLRYTITAVAGGFALGTSFGFLVGLAMGRSATVDKIVGPYVNLFMSVPKAIFLPIFIFAFGLGVPERIYFGAAHAFFIMALNTAIGARSVDPNLIKLGRALKCSRWKMIRSVILPSSLPMVLTGVRYAFLLDFLGILLAEMYISSAGIGSLLVVFGDSLNTPSVFAVVVIIAAIAITANQGLIFMEQRLSSWRQTMR